MPILNREVFAKDPLTWRLLNEGVSSNNATDEDTLRYELETFVCEGEYRTGLTRILQGYLDCLGKEQKAAWVSGFYGSGKSHLVKVLRHLWTDHKFKDGEHARSVGQIPTDVRDLLKELSTRGKQGAGLHSAGGTLKAGVGSVRLRLLGIILQSAGLPEKLSVARLVMDMRDDGKLDEVYAAIRKAGKDPEAEVSRLYTSKAFQQAYLGAYSQQYATVADVGKALTAQYPTNIPDITIDETVKTIRRALAKDGKLPCTLVVLDEVQQFINNDPAVALEAQEVVEACSKMLDGQVMFVGTGQSALVDMPALQRLMGRFSIRVHLKDNDVEKVVRTVVLRKKEDKKADIKREVSTNAGEIERQLKDTKVATRSEDDDAYVPDYPLLPVRRRFWEQVLHSTDSTGTAAQMRTQLKVTHEACRAVADKPLGSIVPADFLYEQLANDLVITGEMQKRFQEIIEAQKTKADGPLRSRVCSLIFLINKLPREGADIGVRATPEHLADLLTDDLGQSATNLRQQIPGIVKALVDDSVLMEVDGEYRLQTTEGAAWETEFRRQRASAINNEPQLSAHRSLLLSQALEEELKALSVLHGAAREKRKVEVHYGLDAPKDEGIVVWVRDGFQEPQTAILKDIQARSVENAMIHALVPEEKPKELKQALASLAATDATLNFKGQPTSNEGREAHAAMVSRQTNAREAVDTLIAGIVREAQVYLSGGQQIPGVRLRAAVEAAGQQVLGRLYPKFSLADSPNWGTVWTRAKEGNPSSLAAVGHQGDPDKHAVCLELIKFIGGAGKKGADIDTQFGNAPYGWPDDAIHGCLAALMMSGHVSAKVQNQPTKLADLDHRKMRQADFRVEQPVLTAKEKLRIRTLFKDSGFKPPVGVDEAITAPGFVQFLKKLHQDAGGPAPAPDAPAATFLVELDGLVGNDLLFALHAKAADIEQRAKAWYNLSQEIAVRLPAYTLATALLKRASELPGAAAAATTLSSVKDNRSLLDEPDPVAPVLTNLESAIRAALRSAHADYERVFTAETAALTAHEAWRKLDPAKQQSFLSLAGVFAKEMPNVADASQLLDSLNVCDIATWQTHTDALPKRFAQALSAAIVDAEPKARRVVLPARTLRTGQDVESWLSDARTEIEAALTDGPVIL